MTRCILLVVILSISCQAALCPAVAVGDKRSGAPSIDEAKAMMWEAYNLTWEGKQPDKAIPILKRVIRYYPDLEADYCGNRCHLVAKADLGWAYFYGGDYENAMNMFQLVQEDQFARDPDNPSRLGYEILKCRGNLAVSGKLKASTVVATDCWVLSKDVASTGDTVTMPASKLAALLHLQLKKGSSSGHVTLISSDKNPRRLTFTSSANTAIGNNQGISLSISPNGSGEGMLIPVRETAQYFGTKVEFDSRLLVLWLGPRPKYK